MNHAQQFQQMHLSSSFLLLPNAWNLQSAIILEQSGFKAIGTTSWGLANSFGKADGENITFKQLLTEIKSMTEALSVPLSVDIEKGYATTNSAIIENVLSLAELGVAGINIEDSLSTGKALKDVGEHCELFSQLRHALDKHGHKHFFINARTDTYFLLENPAEASLERGKAYIDAGASGIFVPGIMEPQEIKMLSSELKAPLNVMSLPGLTDVKELVSLGVARFSIANALSDAAIKFIEQASKTLIETQSTEHLYSPAPVMTEFA